MPPHQTKRHAVNSIKPKARKWSGRDPATVPLPVQSALRRAMAEEAISPTEFDDLLWLMAQESSGQVDARNPHSSARALFQLLRAQYDLNPQGEASFGDAKEECQGGIRYIVKRYRTARKARQFWQSHHWY